MLLRAAFKHGVVFSSARVFLKLPRGDRSKQPGCPYQLTRGMTFRTSGMAPHEPCIGCLDFLCLIVLGGLARSRNHAGENTMKGSNF